MDNSDIEPVETALEEQVAAIGLPKALQALDRQQMAAFISNALRKEPKDETPVPELKSSDG